MTIVGADRLPDSGYLRAKVAQEAEIEAGAIPYTILRATQFFRVALRHVVRRPAGGSRTMTEIEVIVTGPEEAYDNEAEFWRGNELMGVTVLHEGRLHLRIDPRADGSPWLADVDSLARALAEAGQRLAAY